MTTIQQYKDQVLSKVEDLDIGILCVNAGVNISGPFNETSDEAIESMVNVNATQVAYVLKVLIPKMLKRFDDTGVKSAITVTSSGMGRVIAPGFATYCAGKAFATSITEALNYELKGKIDIMSYCAG